MRITLCGSTRFRSEFEQWNRVLTLRGHVVYSVGMFAREDKDEGKNGYPVVTEEQKVILDLVHLAKIDNSDAIVVLNVGGYIGFSTRREIEWAKMKGKKIFYYLLPEGEPEDRLAVNVL